MPSRVLIPVDNQECSYRALQAVLGRNWERDTKFLLCRVVEQLGSCTGGDSSDHQEILSNEQEDYEYQMRLWLSEITDQFATILPNVTSKIVSGEVPKQLCQVAYDWGADYIVMGSHDFNLASRCALGSVASTVLSGAPCSVEIVRCNHCPDDNLIMDDRFLQKQPVAQGHLPKRVIVATDLSREAIAALRWVCATSWAPSTQFRIVTVTSASHKDLRTHLAGVGSLYAKEKHHQESIEHHLKEQARAIAEKLGFEDVEADVILDDCPSEAICQLAGEWQADLVVTGSIGSNRSPAGRAGSTALSIMDRLHCSMIAIQADAAKQVNFSWTNSTKAAC